MTDTKPSEAEFDHATTVISRLAAAHNDSLSDVTAVQTALTYACADRPSSNGSWRKRHRTRCR